MTEQATGSQRTALGTRAWEQIPDVFGNVDDISDALIIREGLQFLVTDAFGRIPPNNDRGLGAYDRDTRHLSVYELLLDGQYPLVMLSNADSGFCQEQVLGNRRFVQDGKVVGRGTIEIDRQCVVLDGLSESVTVANHNHFPVRIRLSYRYDADFADVFEVRGHTRKHHGEHHAPAVDARSVHFRYFGADSRWRQTRIDFGMQPESIGERGASFNLELAPRSQIAYSVRITFREEAEAQPVDAAKRLNREHALWRSSFAKIQTDNEVFDEVLGRCLADLRVLWTQDGDDTYLAAGTPWFATLFGRDSIISALQTLPFNSRIARDCLSLLARKQGTTVDSFRVEEPGKILHETRDDELCHVNELPYERYYGSVDSTPLFLLLAAEYYHWTHDRQFIVDLMPAISAALAWVRDCGDLDGDGFIEHRTDLPDGLRNQGWKDSVEAIVHADGRLLEGPVALAEVQGYVYAAYSRLAPMLRDLGDEQQATLLEKMAVELRHRFNEQFWIPTSRRIAMALDGAKQPADVMSSNAGQVLWSGILDTTKAEAVKASLFDRDMFSGWGVRTLSADCASYMPLGYHLGTVWPHDNAIIAEGLRRYGYTDEVNEIATALFDAARSFPANRLPELFGGQPRGEFKPPVPYPVACRPQAWTAGSFFQILQAMLGLVGDAANDRLCVVKPHLPVWLKEARLTGLQFADSKIDLHFRREGDETRVTSAVTGSAKVDLLNEWPG